MDQVQVTVGSVSREMLKNFTRSLRSNGSHCWNLREDIAWQHQLVMDAHQNRILTPEVYSNIFRILMEIYVAENSEQAVEFLQEVEPYDTVSQLTAWLDASPDNIRYVNLALAENYSTNGFSLLTRAHQLYLQELGLGLVHAIVAHIEKIQQTTSLTA